MADFNTYPLTDTQQQMVRANSQVVGWMKAVYQELKNSKSPQQLDYRRWSKCVCKYYVDRLNLETLEVSSSNCSELYEELVFQTARKMCTTQEHVKAVFKRCRGFEYPSLTLKEMTVNIPATVIERLSQQDPQAFIFLVLRYHILLLNEGLFLSIDPALYQELYDSSTLPVLECYGSPFNHHLPDYCSLFVEDEDYQALVPFQKFLSELNFGVRLCINPPYTRTAITDCITAVLQHMDVCDSEFVMILPVMHNFQPLENLKASPRTVSLVLEPEDYLIYSAIQEVSLTPPIQLYLVVNAGGSLEASQELLESIAKRLKDRAMDFLKTLKAK